MRKLWFVVATACALAVALPAGAARFGGHRAPGPPVASHGKGKGHKRTAPASSSSSIDLLAPWGTAAYSGGRITVKYTLSLSPGVPGSVRTTVLSALNSWNSCFGGGSGCGGISPKSRFSFSATSGTPLLAITVKKGGGTVAGSTKLTYSSGFISSARLQISASSFGSPNTPTTIYEIALHELGHVVGLGHSNASNDLMYPVLNGVTSFGSCEVNGFNALYSSWLGSSSPKLPSQSSVAC
jgi:hypothetical protein